MTFNQINHSIIQVSDGIGRSYLYVVMVTMIICFIYRRSALAHGDSVTTYYSKSYKFTYRAQHRMKERARQVKIYRDAWGTPHVHGHTDADAVFGLAYATAEDRFSQLEPIFIRKLGRSAEVYGKKAVNWDILIHALEIPRHSKEEYVHTAPEIRALARAYADGMNYFLFTHPGVHPMLLNHFKPWYVFAFYRSVDNNLDWTNINLREIADITLPKAPLRHPGSNMWAVGPAKSANGHAMLFMSPHNPLTDHYEVHLMSDSGWNVSGMTAWGWNMVPVVGHNASLGWSLTVNHPGIVGVWKETFDDPAHPLRYRYGKGYKTAVAWIDSIKVRQKDGSLKIRILHFRKTIHGPILAVRNGKALAVKMANIERGGLLQEFYAMGKAHNFKEFRKALSIEGLTFYNVMYADNSGNIYYLYNGAIPRRNPRYDWSKPVDGSDPGTLWRDYLPISDLPQVFNPPSGWMQNTNSSPFLITRKVNPDPEAFPSYIVSGLHFDHQNPRSRESRRLLSRPGKFTFEEWKKMAFDTHFLVADKKIPGLVKAWKQLLATDSSRAEKLRSMVEGLKDWNHNGSISSPEATWFTFWTMAMMDSKDVWITNAWKGRYVGTVKTGPNRKIRALEAVKDTLMNNFGTIQVPWGEINRLQHPASENDETCSDDRPGLPVPGGPSYLVGDIFCFYGSRPKGSRRQYGSFGSGYVSVIDFGPHVKAWSVLPYGESDNPASPHYFDQASLYARGHFKRAWFTLGEVKEHAAFAYHPGDEWGKKQNNISNGDVKKKSEL